MPSCKFSPYLYLILLVMGSLYSQCVICSLWREKVCVCMCVCVCVCVLREHIQSSESCNNTGTHTHTQSRTHTHTPTSKVCIVVCYQSPLTSEGFLAKTEKQHCCLSTYQKLKLKNLSIKNIYIKHFCYQFLFLL